MSRLLSPIGSDKRSDVSIASTSRSILTRLIDSVNEAAPCGDPGCAGARAGQGLRRVRTFGRAAQKNKISIFNAADVSVPAAAPRDPAPGCRYGRAVAQPTPRRGPRRAANRTLAGLTCWLVQPFYLVVELLVAAAASASYSLRDGTISALGQASCAPGHDASAVGVCSSGHTALNTAFVVFGLLRAIGALLLREQIDPTWWRTATISLWVASGICSAAVGLAPVDQHPSAHAWAAAPVFVLQPAAVLATAIALRRSADARSDVGTAGLVVGAASLVGALAFGLRLGQPTWVGALERLALWPAYVWLGLVAATMLAELRTSGRRLADPPGVLRRAP
jgi:hypothetical protein